MECETLCLCVHRRLNLVDHRFGFYKCYFLMTPQNIDLPQVGGSDLIQVGSDFLQVESNSIQIESVFIQINVDLLQVESGFFISGRIRLKSSPT